MLAENITQKVSNNLVLNKSLSLFLRSAVPLAKLFNLSVVQLTDEKTVCTLDATPAAINQNGTLQASTFYILADYAVGLAGFVVLQDFDLLGTPRRNLQNPQIQGWLKDGFVKHIRPATGTIRAEVVISAIEQLRIRQEIIESGKVTYTGEVHIFQEDVLVAIAKHTVVFKAV